MTRRAGDPALAVYSQEDHGCVMSSQMHDGVFKTVRTLFSFFMFFVK